MFSHFNPETIVILSRAQRRQLHSREGGGFRKDGRCVFVASPLSLGDGGRCEIPAGARLESTDRNAVLNQPRFLRWYSRQKESPLHRSFKLEPPPVAEGRPANRTARRPWRAE